MASKKPGSNELFSVFGKVVMTEGGKRFVPKSPPYYRTCLNRLKWGQNVTVTFYDRKAIRTQSQLRYHMVLMGMLSDHTGFTQDEMHDAVMRIVFGEKKVTLLGRSTTVRKSISDSAKMLNEEAQKLIDFDLELCREYEIRVPTREELGYLPEKKHHLVDSRKTGPEEGYTGKS